MLMVQCQTWHGLRAYEPRVTHVPIQVRPQLKNFFSLFYSYIQAFQYMAHFLATCPPRPINYGDEKEILLSSILFLVSSYYYYIILAVNLEICFLSCLSAVEVKQYLKICIKQCFINLIIQSSQGLVFYSETLIFTHTLFTSSMTIRSNPNFSHLFVLCSKTQVYTLDITISFFSGLLMIFY